MTQIAEMLLRKGADPNSVSPHDAASPGSTSLLLYAVQLSEREIAASLLSHGADANMRTEQGMTPLMEARSVPMARLLIRHGADVNAVDSKGRSALQWAEQHRKLGQQMEEADKDGKRKPEGSGYNSPHYREVAAFLRQTTGQK
jgi:ankyrin repeat protein